jgi:rod shape-determining protein MreC
MNDRAPLSGRWGLARRTSFARRDTNLALVGALVTGVVLAFALLLLVIARVNPDQGSRLRGAVLDLLSPVTTVLMLPVRAGEAAIATVRDHLAVVRRIQTLDTREAAAREVEQENRRLRAELAAMDRLLKTRRAERRLIVSAQAAAAAPTGASRTATLSAGARDGVRPRMPVIGAEGVVGRVTDVGLIASRIMLTSDANSRVPVKVARTGWTGIAAGTGARDLRFLYDPASATDRLQNGDLLVTSGDGGLYPPGLPVAVIIDAGANPPLARPVSGPAGLGTVRVEAPWLSPPVPVKVAPAADEADLPPPAPAGATTPTGTAAPAGTAAAGAPAGSASGSPPAGRNSPVAPAPASVPVPTPAPAAGN